MREIIFEYGFQSINGIVKKQYHLNEIPYIREKRDVWNKLPVAYIREWTGLTDKNGVEIYEGDILKTKNGICSVIWFDAAFALKSPGSEAIDFEHSSIYELSEVIGNIHENPELLCTSQST